MAEELVIAQNVSKQYKTTVAVEEVSFRIPKGVCVGFLGPNGAGKTTLMKMLYCFTSRSSGDLKIFGYDPGDQAREIKASLGVVPQEENLDPDLSVLENMMVYGRYFSLKKSTAQNRTLQLLDFVQLLDKKHEKIEHLSGGMKRRLLIARALINQPRIIILDEPTTGLDPQARLIVWQKLKQLKEGGASLVLTTHDMDEAERLCDHLFIMDHGRILTRGAPAELIEAHVGKEVLELHVGEARVNATIQKLAHFRLDFARSGDTVFFYANQDQDLSACYPLIEGEDFFHRRASLEDVFLKLAGHGLNE